MVHVDAQKYDDSHHHVIKQVYMRKTNIATFSIVNNPYIINANYSYIIW